VGSTDLAAAMISGEAWFKVPESIRFRFSGKLRPWVGGKDLILYTIGKIGVGGALYEAMEFTGELIANLPMDDRLTVANMAVEAGAKSGIFPPDEITLQYIKDRANRPYRLYQSDPNAHYVESYDLQGEDIEPQVAFPHLPENVKPISQVGQIPIDQVVIGSCTNGRISDLRVAAKILKGRKVAPLLRLIIIPATQAIYQHALKEGLLEIFVEAEGVVSAPTCGPCMGGHMGILAEGERAVSTTNRNFVGRMGHPKSEVYLASPAVAAASAILGRIGSPEEI
jgi:3-isopropylmalate/(R)-2-methylmalate dehydratase large subunit